MAKRDQERPSISLARLSREALLPRFYARATVQVAQELLGKVLTVADPQGERLVSVRIVETEAYQGNDPASHSSRGETPRTSVMFGEPGIAYVYFIYGMYEMLNFVTEKKGTPGAVLIRAVEPLLGEDWIARRRPGQEGPARTNGPGKLCRALGIRLDQNGQKLQGPELFVTDDGARPSSILCSPRVGISQGRESMWRFFIEGHPYVSRVPENKKAVPA